MSDELSIWRDTLSGDGVHTPLKEQQLMEFLG